MYVDDSRSVVMVDDAVIVLSELATAILEAVPDGRETGIDQIAVAVVAVFGEPEPPDTAAELTLVNVQALIGHRVLVSADGTGPAVTTSTPAAVAALRSALRHIRSGQCPPWRLPSPVTSDEFIAAAHQHQVVSYLDKHHERLALPPGLAAMLHASSMQRAAAVDVFASELRVALDALDRAGVRVIVFKGMALALQAHDDIAARGAGDLDLLVAPEDLERAHATLTSSGWRHDSRFPHPGPTWAWRHLRRTGYEVTLFGGSSTIDLHWQLSPSHGTYPPFETLWRRRSIVSVNGRDIPTLSPFDAFAHSAGHAAKDEWAWLRSLVDVHLLASDTATWHEADRALRGDQLMTVGLAARMFGVPTSAPPIATEAVLLTAQVWDSVLARQSLTSSTHATSPRLGASLGKGLRTHGRTGAASRDMMRQLGFSLMPPWLTVHEDSRHSVVAVPRLLARRVRGVISRRRP